MPSNLALVAASSLLVITSASVTLPKYTGPTPPWKYRGYEAFPAHFFGANQSGPPSAAELALIAKHQFAGWGWQAGDNITSALDDGHFYSEETTLAQIATRFASYVEFSSAPKVTQGVFVYRHSEMALSWFTLQRAAYNNSANDDFWMKDDNGEICWNRTAGRSGPAWNFSNPRAADFFVDEVVGELTREASINSVFFDETDSAYCGGNPCRGRKFSPSELAAMYQDKIAVLRRVAIKLNKAGIWPIFSTFNVLTDPKFSCPLPYMDYYGALKDVGWFRFYEFFGPKSLTTFMAEAAAGLPVVVHAQNNLNDNLALATFLLGQGDHTYFGTSDGWTDDGWAWHDEYDEKYGTPLGPAKQTSEGWSREFSGCSVWMNTEGTNATITMKKGTEQ